MVYAQWKGQNPNCKLLVCVHFTSVAWPSCLQGLGDQASTQKSVLPLLNGMCSNSLKGPEHHVFVCAGTFQGQSIWSLYMGILCLPCFPLTFLYSFQECIWPPTVCIWDTEMNAIGYNSQLIGKRDIDTDHYNTVWCMLYEGKYLLLWEDTGGSSDIVWDTGMGAGHQMPVKISCKKWSVNWVLKYV